MPTTSPDRIMLTGSQRRELDRLVRAGRTEQRLAMRAEIVLAAADGQSNARDRAVTGDLRGHRAQMATPLVRRTGGGLAGRCETLRSPADVHRGAGRPGQGDGLHATRGRGVAAGAVVVPGAGPPGRQRAGSARRSRRRRCAGGCPRTRSNPGSTSRGSSSPTPTSPPRPTACSTCTTANWDGKPLGANDYVISADEKTSIQARCRCHPTLPPGKARTMRVNHDYDRRGAVAYLAAYDVHRGGCSAAARTPPASSRSPPGRPRS